MAGKIQLFCIPYAGGTADSFQELGILLEPLIETIPLEYAGHGLRRKEPFYNSFDELGQDLAEQLRQRRDQSMAYALFGYSMGSIAVYELLAGHLTDSCPEHIFIASHEAPDADWEGKKYAALEDDAFMAEMVQFGGFPRYDGKLLQNRFFRQLYFQPVREDYRLLAGYRMQVKEKLPADVTVFYSPEDIQEERIRSWDSFAGKGIEYIALGRNHFFIRDCVRELSEIIKQRIP